jgi:hypothetical protein
MSYGTTGIKRQREANRDRKKKDKEERLRRNRALRAQGYDPGADAGAAQPVEAAPIRLEDINISGVAPRGPKGSHKPRRLFVGGLSWDTTSESLREAFSRFGPLTEAAVVNDRDTRRSRGFGFVTFENAVDATRATAEMDGASLDGRTLRVNPADR